jgi:hypothetical protein
MGGGHGDRTSRLGLHIRRHPAPPASRVPAVRRRFACAARRHPVVRADSTTAARLVVVEVGGSRHAQRRRVLHTGLHCCAVAPIWNRVDTDGHVAGRHDAARLADAVRAAEGIGAARCEHRRGRRLPHAQRRNRLRRPDRDCRFARSDGSLLVRIPAHQAMELRRGRSPAHGMATARRRAGDPSGGVDRRRLASPA